MPLNLVLSDYFFMFKLRFNVLAEILQECVFLNVSHQQTSAIGLVT